MFYSVFKQLAFKVDPELTHNLIINSSSYLTSLTGLFQPLRPDSRLRLQQGDLTWNFPVGLAAGFDKNAKAIKFFERMGFGSVEVGTVTKLPQIGNPTPRIWRHPSLDSLQNAMGFPNGGSQEMTQNLQKADLKNICLGVNIGKNKDTSEADTASEYAYLYQTFANTADYLVINVSSPNTPGLRQFQDKSKLQPILEAVAEERSKISKPCFIKISPDMDEQDIKLVCELSKEKNFSGIIATNTTIQHDFGKGGLSGKYIKPMAKSTRKKVCEILREDPGQHIIGVGGIDCYEDIKEFWQQGGGFVQVYTAFIYHGPELLKSMASEMMKDLKSKDMQNVQELVSYYQKK